MTLFMSSAEIQISMKSYGCVTYRSSNRACADCGWSTMKNPFFLKYSASKLQDESFCKCSITSVKFKTLPSITQFLWDSTALIFSFSISSGPSSAIQHLFRWSEMSYSGLQQRRQYTKFSPGWLLQKCTKKKNKDPTFTFSLCRLLCIYFFIYWFVYFIY